MGKIFLLTFLFIGQPSEDRALYYRQLRDTIRTSFLPELTSAQAIDAAALVDRILAEFIVEEEAAPALSETFGRAVALRHDDVERRQRRVLRRRRCGFGRRFVLLRRCRLRQRRQRQRQACDGQESDQDQAHG